MSEEDLQHEEEVVAESPDESVAEAEPTSEGPAHRRFTIRTDVKKRVDSYLQNRLKGISRSRVQKLIDLGGVTVNGKLPKASTLIRAGDVIDVILPPQANRRIEPEDIPLDVLYEDEHFIVLNKQAGVIVHPARSNLSGTLINGLAWRFKQQVEAAGGTYQDRQTTGFKKERVPHRPQGAPERRGSRNFSRHESRAFEPSGDVEGLSSVGAQEFRPGIIHRLDKNTTGVIVVAKSDQAHWLIARQFEDRTTLKAYLAVVHGNLEEFGGAVEQPIGKHPTIREAMTIRHDSLAKHALTLFRVREQYKGYSLVELELKTGRTHQIRVHMQYLGHPIVGDILYGGEPIGTPELDEPPLAMGARRRFLPYARDKEEGEKLEVTAKQRSNLILAHPALHAAFLNFTHPITQQRVTYTAPLHEPVRSLVRELRKRRITAPVANEGYWINLEEAVPN